MRQPRKTKPKAAQRKGRTPDTEHAPMDRHAIDEAVSLLAKINTAAKSRLDQFRTLASEDEAHSGEESPARLLQNELQRQFNQIFEHADPHADEEGDTTHAPRKTHEVDIEKELDALLISSGVMSRRIRWQLKNVFVPLVKRAKARKSIQPSLEALANVEREERRQSMPLPDKAPKLYAEREDRSQDVIAFLRDPRSGWWPYIEAGLLSKSDIRTRDPQCYQALLNFQQHHEMPTDMVIPSQREQVDRMLKAGAIPVSQIQRVGRSLRHRKTQAAKKAEP